MLVHFDAGLGLVVRTFLLKLLVCLLILSHCVEAAPFFLIGRTCISGDGSQIHKIQCKPSEFGAKVM